MTDDIRATIVLAKPAKSVWAAFFLTFLFGPLGLLYATVGGGIFMIFLAMVVGFFTLGFGLIFVWLLSMIWGVTAAILSKSSVA